VSAAGTKDYQPANITFDLLPALDEDTRQRLRKDKKARHALICQQALDALAAYLSDHPSPERHARP
jgi:methylenetetrahydrofolate--tRNA-(uracil-5-)-methyltransferase